MAGNWEDKEKAEQIFKVIYISDNLGKLTWVFKKRKKIIGF
jgi:hypothetical protein